MNENDSIITDMHSGNSNDEISQGIVGLNHKIQADAHANSQITLATEERELNLRLKSLEIQERQQALKERQDQHNLTQARSIASNDHLVSTNAQTVQHQSSLNNATQQHSADLHAQMMNHGNALNLVNQLAATNVLPTLQMGSVGAQALGARIVEPGDVAERVNEHAMTSGAVNMTGASNIAGYTAANQVASTQIATQLSSMFALVNGLSRQVADLQSLVTANNIAHKKASSS